SMQGFKVPMGVIDSPAPAPEQKAAEVEIRVMDLDLDRTVAFDAPGAVEGTRWVMLVQIQGAALRLEGGHRLVDQPAREAVWIDDPDDRLRGRACVQQPSRGVASLEAALQGLIDPFLD